jgi:hypothetical protein
MHIAFIIHGVSFLLWPALVKQLLSQHHQIEETSYKIDFYVYVPDTFPDKFLYMLL